MAEGITLIRDRALAWITLKRPATFNALARADWEALEAVAFEIAEDPTIGCVIVRGAGVRAFSTGLDMARFAEERRNPIQAKAYSEATGRATDRLAALPMPTIAMIEGYCMGSGVDIACHLDLRIAADDALFRVSPKTIGLYLDRTFVNGLVRTLGRARALEMTLEGRTYTADWALEIGLVGGLVPAAALEAEITRLAVALAAAYAATSP